MRCTACGFENPPPMRFCGGCGQTLATEAPAERRDVTILFFDLVGSTRLSEQLDPEELGETVHAYQDLVGEVVAELDGYVAQYLGDGVLVYFGYPRAHEDDEVRAVHAGLEVLQRVGGLNERLAARGVTLELRVGVHTGSVVVGRPGEGRGREDVAVGVAPNVAARLQDLAEAGTLVMSADTQRRVRDHFVCQSLGAKQFKGLSAPIEVFRALGAADRDDPLTTAGLEGPLRGRSRELEGLIQVFADVRAGRRRAQLVSGEAGIGKSRLVRGLHESVSNESRWVVCSCSPHAQGSALRPVIDTLERTFGIQPRSTAAERHASLEAGLRGFGPRHTDVLPLFADLLRVSLPGDANESLDLSPDRARHRTFEALVELLGQWAAVEPLVLLVEDLHWADPSTLEFVSQVANLGPERTLLLVTTRSGSEAPWAGETDSVLLSGLDALAIESLAADVAGAAPLSPDILRQIAGRTDGLPLFAQELTRAILESGALKEGPLGRELPGGLEALELPTTLRASLTAMIDRIPSARPVAQMGAALGRDFGFELIREVSDLPEPVLCRELEKLVTARILVQHGEPPGAIYSFRHALMQEAAYQLMIRRVRREHHAKIADVLVDRFPEQIESRPEVVARHFTQAQRQLEAIDYWHRASYRALARSATVEAASHLEAGLALLAEQPPGPERDSEELAFQIALGNASIATRGFAVPEVERIYRRAGELCGRMGARPERFWTIQGLYIYHLVRAEFDEALGTAHELLELSRTMKSLGHDAVAAVSIGIVRFHMGDFRQSIEWLRRGIENAPDDDNSMRENVGFDLLVNAHSNSALSCWHLGEFGRSAEHARIALERGANCGHAFSHAYALVFVGCELQHFRRDVARARVGGGQLFAHSEHHGFPVWQIQGALFEGWAAGQTLAEEEREAFEETCQRMVGSLALFRASGSRLALSYLSSLWVETLAALGREDEARKLLDDLIAEAAATRNRMWEPELLRLRGELHAGMAPGVAANAYRAACSSARDLGSRALELRASLSLARLLASRGEQTQGHEILAAACEGLEDPGGDSQLAEARRFLAEA